MPTIKEYLDKIPDVRSKEGISLKDTVTQIINIWSNDACQGYCIRAMEKCGMSHDQIRDVMLELTTTFDDVSVDEAEQIWYRF